MFVHPELGGYGSSRESDSCRAILNWNSVGTKDSSTANEDAEPHPGLRSWLWNCDTCSPFKSQELLNSTNVTEQNPESPGLSRASKMLNFILEHWSDCVEAQLYSGTLERLRGSFACSSTSPSILSPVFVAPFVFSPNPQKASFPHALVLAKTAFGGNPPGRHLDMLLFRALRRGQEPKTWWASESFRLAHYWSLGPQRFGATNRPGMVDGCRIP